MLLSFVCLSSLLVYFHNPIAYMQVERDYNGIPINAAKEQEEQETAKEIQEWYGVHTHTFSVAFSHAQLHPSSVANPSC